MATIGTLTAKIGADTSGLFRGLSSAERRMKSGAQSIRTNIGTIKNSLTSLKTIATAAFAGWGISKIGGEFLDAAKTTENYRVRLNAALGSVSEGSRLFQEMADYAGRVPFEYREIMDSATALSGVMKGGVNEIKQWMPMIGDLAAFSGLTIQDTTSQIIRMYSAGAGAADLFRERGVLAMLGFKAGAQYSAEETRRMLFSSWNAVDSKFKGVTAELAKTWTGLTSMIRDKWFQVRDMVMAAGVFDRLKSQTKDLIDYIDKLKSTGQLDIWAKNIGDSISRWVDATERFIKLNWHDYLNKIKTSLKEIWSILSYDPAIIEYGLIGLVLGGKKGAVIGGSIGHIAKMFEYQAKAMALVMSGYVDFSDVAKANFKELEEMLKPFEADSWSGILGDRQIEQTKERISELKGMIKDYRTSMADVLGDIENNPITAPLLKELNQLEERLKTLSFQKSKLKADIQIKSGDFNYVDRWMPQTPTKTISTPPPITTPDELPEDFWNVDRSYSSRLAEKQAMADWEIYQQTIKDQIEMQNALFKGDEYDLDMGAFDDGMQHISSYKDLINEQTTAWEGLRYGIADAAREMQSFAELGYTIGNALPEVISTNFGQSFMEFVDGTKSAKEAFIDFAKETLEQLLQMIVTQMIYNAVAGAMSAGTNNISAGMTNNIPRGYSGSGFLNQGSGRASGGPVMSGESYIVGEEGPEILTMGSSRGYITPNDKLGGNPPPSVILNVENKTDTEMKGSASEPEFDGKRWVVNMWLEGYNDNIEGIQGLLNRS